MKSIDVEHFDVFRNETSARISYIPFYVHVFTIQFLATNIIYFLTSEKLSGRILAKVSANQFKGVKRILRFLEFAHGDNNLIMDELFMNYVAFGNVNSISMNFFNKSCNDSKFRWIKLRFSTSKGGFDSNQLIFAIFRIFQLSRRRKVRAMNALSEVI